ncbi:hypothetical protein FORC066_0894 [Yersinia enterocolitica]|nr:hypothetical protein FORC065_3547 [Yersinia enterocolitica]UXD28110.1 hypothetical protein FORC066_0894 [Yersinia enterocolitica]
MALSTPENSDGKQLNLIAAIMDLCLNDKNAQNIKIFLLE